MKHHAISGLALAILAIAGASSSSTAQAPSPSPAARSIRGSCIDPRQIANQTIVSDQEIQFRLKNKEVWVNKLPARCFGLKFEDGFEWEINGTLVCSNQQRINVLRTGVPCLLGEFSKAS